MVFDGKAYDELFHADDPAPAADQPIEKPKKESAQVTESAIDTPDQADDEPEYKGAGDPPEDDAEGGEE